MTWYSIRDKAKDKNGFTMFSNCSKALW